VIWLSIHLKPFFFFTFLLSFFLFFFFFFCSVPNSIHLKFVWSFWSTSPCCEYNQRIVSVFNAVLPEGLKITTQFGFQPHSFAHRDFFGFSEPLMIIWTRDDEIPAFFEILLWQLARAFFSESSESLPAFVFDRVKSLFKLKLNQLVSWVFAYP